MKSTINLSKFKINSYQPWWPSGLIHHAYSQLKDSGLGPRFESCLWHMYGTVNVIRYKVYTKSSTQELVWIHNMCFTSSKQELVEIHNRQSRKRYRGEALWSHLDKLLDERVKALKPIWIQAPNQEPALELHSRAAPSVEAHHRSVGPDARRNSGGKGIIKKSTVYCILCRMFRFGLLDRQFFIFFQTWL